MFSKLHVVYLIWDQKKGMVPSNHESLSWMTWFIRVYDVGAGNDTSVHSRTIPCTNPSLFAGNSSTSVSPFYRALKCTQQVFQSLAWFPCVSRKQKRERFGKFVKVLLKVYSYLGKYEEEDVRKECKIYQIFWVWYLSVKIFSLTI